MHLEPTLRGQGSSMLGAPMAQGSHLPFGSKVRVCYSFNTEQE